PSSPSQMGWCRSKAEWQRSNDGKASSHLLWSAAVEGGGAQPQQQLLTNPLPQSEPFPRLRSPSHFVNTSIYGGGCPSRSNSSPSKGFPHSFAYSAHRLRQSRDRQMVPPLLG